MKRPIGDIAASVKQRLLNVARERGEEFEQVLVRFAAERFLYRLSRSIHSNSFLLKGAMLFVAWEGMPHRVTRDLDLLGVEDATPERVEALMREIVSVEAEGDGLLFDPGSIETAGIRTIHEQGGVRVTMTATLGKARIRLQIDVGFGDAVTPGPEAIEFPAIIDLPRAQLRAYPVETVVAEKSLAMIERGLLTSRLKDYFDLRHLSGTRSFEAAGLCRALGATAHRRGVAIPQGPVSGLSEVFASDPARQAQWTAFCRRLRADGPRDSLGQVVAALSTFLEPIFASVSAGREGSGHWQPGGPWT